MTRLTCLITIALLTALGCTRSFERSLERSLDGGVDGGVDGSTGEFCPPGCPRGTPPPPPGFEAEHTCYDGCNWIDCRDGSQTARACSDGGPSDGGDGPHCAPGCSLLGTTPPPGFDPEHTCYDGCNWIDCRTGSQTALPCSETRLVEELSCRLTPSLALAASARAVACQPEVAGTVRTYYEAWEAGLFGSIIPEVSYIGIPIHVGCDAWRCVATATSCDAFEACLDEGRSPGACDAARDSRCNGSRFERCGWDDRGYYTVFDCATVGATCDPTRGCVLSDDCSFGISYYELACDGDDLVLCDGLVRAHCDAVETGRACSSFSIGGEVPTAWCSPSGEPTYGIYNTPVECAGGTIRFTSATGVDVAYDCDANGYAGCTDRGCVP